MSRHSPAVQRLIDLGFSQYEAQAYVGLLGREPLTGYGLANITGIPQPKVYETLRRLTAKGVVGTIDGEPARFVAVPADELLSSLEDSFRGRLAAAQHELTSAVQEPSGNRFRVLRSFPAWAAIEEYCVEMVRNSRRHVYVSVNCADPAAIAAALQYADGRGVACDVLHFGEPVAELRHGRTVGHDSTRGVIYRRHQARHLAVVADSVDVLWAVAEDGSAWQSLAGRDGLLAALAKGYIRHDIYVQEIWNEFHDVLQDRYGPGMQQLVGRLSGRPADRERAAAALGSAGQSA